MSSAFLMDFVLSETILSKHPPPALSQTHSKVQCFVALSPPSHVVIFHPCLQVLCPLPNQTLSTCDSCEVLFSREQIPHLVMILLALGFWVEFALRCFHLALGWCCFPLAEHANAIFHWQPAFSWQCHTVLDWCRCQCVSLADWCLHTCRSSVSGCGYCGCLCHVNRVQQAKKKCVQTPNWGSYQPTAMSVWNRLIGIRWVSLALAF